MATNEAVRWFMMIGFLVVSISQSCAYGKPEVPCFFIFGDSLLDNGNNNFLPTLRVNYLPYGIDYPTGPTGRFCNGRTPVDVLGFRVTNAGCCGVGRNNGQITCLPFQTPCQNRNEYLFWDAFHPTEAGNAVIARRGYSAVRASDAYPIDIRRLALL